MALSEASVKALIEYADKVKKDRDYIIKLMSGLTNQVDKLDLTRKDYQRQIDEFNTILRGIKEDVSIPSEGIN